ncbi:hypothetical protein [Rhodopseudomonas palustris]|uniref:hypothetical protein n=2 Tax=Rhodopseudomonas TaxID=1073 RepID=UPI000B302AD8|nr:hypothetical protein [Rhodopseudomonas palustris]
MTQTWLAEPVSGDRLTYEAVFCLACSQQHFICVATGRALGDSAGVVTKLRGPAFPPKQIQMCHERAAMPRYVGGLRSPSLAASDHCHKLH